MTDQKLLPCPFCGGKARIKKYDNEYDVICDICACSTRVTETKADAIKFWNNRIAPALQWTKEPPTEKDLGKWFCWRSKHKCGMGRLNKSKPMFEDSELGEYLFIEYFGSIESLCELEFIVFLGPLPE